MLLQMNNSLSKLVAQGQQSEGMVAATTKPSAQSLRRLVALKKLVARKFGSAPLIVWRTFQKFQQNIVKILLKSFLKHLRQVKPFLYA